MAEKIAKETTLDLRHVTQTHVQVNDISFVGNIIRRCICQFVAIHILVLFYCIELFLSFVNLSHICWTLV